MILSYKKQFPWGDPTNFKEKILSGTKIHTFRADPHGRWKVGRHIHHAHGVRTKNYDCFLENDCVSVQAVQIQHFGGAASLKKRIVIGDYVFPFFEGWNFINPSPSLKIFEKLAKNDGFDSTEDFFKWFSSDFQGWIIHWTGLKY